MPHVAGLRGVLSDGARDSGRAIYRYHQTFAGPGRTLTRKSFACAVRLSAFTDGAIHPHEATTDAARDAELASIRASGAQTSPVLFGVRDHAGEVDRVFRKTETQRPTLEVTTPDGTQHRLWRVQDAEVIGKLRHYLTPLPLLVLEGHATYEAMLAHRAELDATSPLAMYSSAGYTLGFIVPLDDPGLVAAARHRVITGSTVTREQALATAAKHFILEQLPGTDVGTLLAALGDSVAHQPAFVAAFAGEPHAWKLTLSPEISAVAEGVDVHRALQKYDPVVVQHLFVERCLPGAQVTTATDATRALAALGEGARAALLVRPLSLEQIKHVDELGARLPPQSTAFHPAILPGVLGFVIDRDEDLV